MLCGFSSSLNTLVLWRLVQGAGGAALLSTAQATLRQIFPARAGHRPNQSSRGRHRRADAPVDARRMDYRQRELALCFFINLPIGLISAFLVMNLSARPAASCAPHRFGRLVRHRAAHHRRRVSASCSRRAI